MYKSKLVWLLLTGFLGGCQDPLLSSEKPHQSLDLNSSDLQRVTVYTTAKDTDKRLTLTHHLSFEPGVQPFEAEVSVFVNPNKRYQKVLGFGGAITDASSEVFASLPLDKQEELLKAYFDKDEGIGYTLIRTSIHSSDFGSASHTYIDEGDKTLSTFDIEKDREFRLPFIKRAMAAAGGEITFYASPWSAPAFMKTNNNMLRGGKLLPEYYETWAQYFVKFIKAYEAEDIPVWGVTIQNEPMAVQRWESMLSLIHI